MMRPRLAAIAAGCTVGIALSAPLQAGAHDSSDTPSGGIVSSNDGFYTDGGRADDAGNGYRVFLSSPRHTDSRYRGECAVNTVNGDEENVNGRQWNWYAANTEYWLNGYDPENHNRNLHSRGYAVLLSPNLRDGNFAGSMWSADNWGADMYIVTHSNAAAGGCAAGSPSYSLVMWRHDSDAYDDRDLAEAIRDKLSPPPGTAQLAQRTDLAELSFNAPLGDAYVELAFHTNPVAQDWMHEYSAYHAWVYGYAIDVYTGYPS